MTWKIYNPQKIDKFVFHEFQRWLVFIVTAPLSRLLPLMLMSSEHDIPENSQRCCFGFQSQNIFLQYSVTLWQLNISWTKIIAQLETSFILSNLLSKITVHNRFFLSLFPIQNTKELVFFWRCFLFRTHNSMFHIYYEFNLYECIQNSSFILTIMLIIIQWIILWFVLRDSLVRRGDFLRMVFLLSPVVEICNAEKLRWINVPIFSNFSLFQSVIVSDCWLHKKWNDVELLFWLFVKVNVHNYFNLFSF